MKLSSRNSSSWICVSPPCFFPDDAPIVVEFQQRCFLRALLPITASPSCILSAEYAPLTLPCKKGTTFSNFTPYKLSCKGYPFPPILSPRTPFFPKSTSESRSLNYPISFPLKTWARELPSFPMQRSISLPVFIPPPPPLESRSGLLSGSFRRRRSFSFLFDWLSPPLQRVPFFRIYQQATSLYVFPRIRRLFPLLAELSFFCDPTFPPDEWEVPSEASISALCSSPYLLGR